MKKLLTITASFLLLVGFGAGSGLTQETPEKPAGEPAAADQNGQGGLTGFLSQAAAGRDQNGNRLPPKTELTELEAKKTTHTEKSTICDDNILVHTFYYPQGTGRQSVDLGVRNMVIEEMNKNVAEIKQEGFCAADECGESSCGRWPVTQTFSVYQSSPDYISILFEESGFTGGAHTNTVFTVLNYNLKNGRQLTLAEVFPDQKRSLPLYWDYVYAKWCAENGYKFPLHYNSVEDCAAGIDPDNPNTYQGADNLDDLGRLVFSAKGATLVLGPYESGSYANGTRTLDLPLAELLKIGASPTLWKQGE